MRSAALQSPITLSVSEITGKSLCLASDTGQAVYNRLAVALQEERKVVLSFRDVDEVSAAFLSSAIGQLYAHFAEARIRDSIALQDMQSEDIELLKYVVEGVKAYLADPEKIKRAWRMEIGNDIDE